MQSTYLLAHDLGTTGNKATLFDERGRLLASAFAPYRIQCPRPGWAEQDPGDWWAAVCTTTRSLLEARPDAARGIAAVSTSGMMNGVVLLDADGEVVRPAIIHADVRARAQCERLAREFGAQRAYELTGNRLAPYFTLGKLAWLREQEPESLRRARWCVQAKDYVAGRLTGVRGFTDPSDASLTGLLDMRAGRWSDELAAAAGLDVRILPDIVASTAVVGAVSSDAAAAAGLRPGTPVVLGGGDGACATAGAGAVAAGDAYHYLGATSWIASVLDSYRSDPQARVSVLCGLAPGQFVRYGTVQSAGSSVEWFLDAVGVGAGVGSRYAALDALAEASQPGARGLYFLPYLQGERSPIWDADARGAFVGLTLAHRRSDLARAVLEGVAFALRAILDCFEELGDSPPQVRVLGGGMRSNLWRRIVAAAYGRPLVVMERLSEATACGAAAAAAVGIGLLRDWNEARVFAPVANEEEPIPGWTEAYATLAGAFVQLYPALAPHFRAVANHQHDGSQAR